MIFLIEEVDDPDVILEGHDVCLWEVGHWRHIRRRGLNGAKAVLGEGNRIELHNQVNRLRKDSMVKMYLEVCLEEKICGVIQAPFTRLFHRCSGRERGISMLVD